MSILRSPLFVLSVLALTACGTSGATSTAATSTASEGGEATPTQNGDPCAGLQALQVQVAEGVPPIPEEEYHWEECVPAGRGAWTLEIALLSLEQVHPEWADDPEMLMNIQHGQATFLWHEEGGHEGGGHEGGGHEGGGHEGGGHEGGGHEGGGHEGGQVHRAPPIDFTRSEIDGNHNYRSFSLIDVFDFDGDGRGELVYRDSDAEFEGGASDRSGVLQATDQGVQAYAPAATFADAIFHLEDLDDDGRPEIHSLRPYSDQALVVADYEAQYPPAPIGVWHSLPDGSFSHQDAVAVQGALASCARLRSRNLLDEAPEEEVAADYDPASAPASAPGAILQQDHGFNDLLGRVRCRALEGVAIPDLDAALERDLSALNQDQLNALNSHRLTPEELRGQLIESARQVAQLRPTP